MYDPSVLKEEILKAWAMGISVDGIVDETTRNGLHLLSRPWQTAIHNGETLAIAQILRRDIIEYLSSHRLCDYSGRPLPIMNARLIQQFWMLYHRMGGFQNTWAVAQAMKTSGLLGSHCRLMTDGMIHIAMLHMVHQEQIRLEAALWHKNHDYQLRIDRCLDEIIEGAPMHDTQGRPYDADDPLDNPFARLLPRNETDDYRTFFAEPRHREPTQWHHNQRIMRADPNHGYIVRQDIITGEVWTEDDDGDIILAGNEPPWGWIPKAHYYGL